MDRGELDSRRKIGTVKAAINLYGERIHEDKPAPKKSQMAFSEPISRTRDLHLAKRGINQFSESKRVAESEKAQAEYELFNAKKTVKDLTQLIEKLSSKEKLQMQDLDTVKKPKRHENEWAAATPRFDAYQYSKVMKELELVKQEISKLKLDLASVLREKLRADEDIEASGLKMCSCSNSMEALRKEIEEVNEEDVLVELARIEAVKEFGAIEAQRKKEACEFSLAMDKTKERMKDAIQEIDHVRELETRLALTMADIDVLQNGLKLVQETEKRVQRNDSLKHFEVGKGEEESSSLLEAVTEVLQSAKDEFDCVKDEGFRNMASMDIVRNELKHVLEEIALLKTAEEKTDLTVQNLNSKLLRVKSKLEAASLAEENARSLASNLTLTLEEMKTEAEAAKKEKELTNKVTATIKEELKKTEFEIDSTDERLQAAMLELEELKSSETIALENLKILIENTMAARASVSQNSSSITISSFEYMYLTGCAAGAEEIADKKVAAAQAWTEALRASEKEILMRTEISQREIRELRIKEEQEVYRAETLLSAKKAVEGELRNCRQRSEKFKQAKNFRLQVESPRKSIKDGGNLTPARRAKLRKSASPATRLVTRTNSYTVRKRLKVMPNLAKFFASKRTEKKI
ncbi:protein PLASTID MOVEMENT IMPAIRED 2 [Malania oleifera]|uniref:protein PLASTID MOVEMENT IMPAIRED 2 n=1 Tax=Malania oleifera TaxID=397392 RepID=UPI0025ADA1FE|nr:protein PLASTID MOVEMENT IMPAIRED 2 [Malania oleifera]